MYWGPFGAPYTPLVTYDAVDGSSWHDKATSGDSGNGAAGTTL